MQQRRAKLGLETCNQLWQTGADARFHERNVCDIDIAVGIYVEAEVCPINRVTDPRLGLGEVGCVHCAVAVGVVDKNTLGTTTLVEPFTPFGVT